MKHRESETNSSEIFDLISKRPNRLIRSGNMYFFIVLLVLLAITYFIKYPDIVTGSLKLVAVDPPVAEQARVEGKLKKLFITNEQTIKSGEVLALIDAAAEHEQVFALRAWINKMETAIKHDSLYYFISDPLPTLTNLGELQVSYHQFHNSLLETIEIYSKGYYQKKMHGLTRDLHFVKALQQNVEKEKRLSEDEFELQKIEYKAYETLANDKVIAPLELNEYKNRLLAKQRNLEQINNQLIENSLALHNKNKELLDLKKVMYDYEQKFASAIFDMKSVIENWVRKYVIVSSANGKILFNSFLQENQMLGAGQVLFYIQPSQSRVYGEMFASQKGLGKVSEGQKVIIKVASYPHNEFGFITGRVQYISNMPGEKDSFLLKIDLPYGLKTNHNQIIFFRNNLFATAEILTNNRRLAHRVLGRLIMMFD